MKKMKLYQKIALLICCLYMMVSGIKDIVHVFNGDDQAQVEDQ